MVSRHDNPPLLFEWLVILVFAGTALVLIVNVSDGTILKPAILYLLSALLIAVSISRALEAGKLRATLSWMHLAFLAYIVLATISLLKAQNLNLGATAIMGLVCYFAVFAVCAGLSTDRTGRERLLRSFIAVSVVASLAGVLQIYLSSGSQAILIPKERGAVSTFGNVTYFAGFLAPMLPIIASRIMTSRRARHRILLGLLAILMTYLLITTESRSGWAGAIAGIVTLIFLSSRSRKTKWMMLGSLLAIGLVLIIGFPQMVQQRLLATFETGPASSVTRRLYFYRGAWNAFLDSPVIGQGLGNFTVFLPKFREPDYWLARSEDIVAHAHNEFLEVLSETGAAGFTALMAVLFLYARSVGKGLKSSEGNDRIYIAAFASGIAAILVDNLASLNLRTVPVAVAFWMIAALSLRDGVGKTYSLAISLPPSFRALRFAPYLAFGLLAAWYVPRVSNSYIAQRYALEGDLLRIQNKASESSVKYAQALRHDPDLAEIRLYLAAQLAHEARYHEARKNIDTLLMRYPYYPKARFVLAISAFETGDTTVALQSINDEIKIENSPQTLYYASYMEERVGHRDRECGHLTTLLVNAVRGASTEFAAEAIDGLADACGHADSTRDETGLVAEVRRAFPHDVKLLVAIGGFYERSGMLSEADSTWRQALKLQPGDEELRSRLTHLEEIRAGDSRQFLH